MSQNRLMNYDPVTGEIRPYPSHAEQYRKWHGLTAWLFNPWTGKKRDPRDIGSDVQGFLISSDIEEINAHCACMASNRAELLAEDIECLHMCLDDAGVPREDEDGKIYSMWGRVLKYKGIHANAEHNRRECNERHG